MSFNTANGTRGARQPKAGWLTSLFNNWSMRRMRSKGGKVMGMDALVLTTVGRKSGEERSTPVAWFPGGGGTWLIVASAAGAPKNPAWYYNIAAHPDQVQVELDGRKVAVTAEQLNGAERDAAWKQIASALPRFTKYEEQTDREIPVIRLTPR
ncbi:nitroreductase family deazaflavin-dependent oxidoreductase [Mycobacterium sp. NPDC050441]|uniref:nitroreductase family deazaflavin-dependent oxidoreductase n=1 Tax=Mycobacterium sp. NPDC050441 TaxID=3155403 RepID=UPI0033CAEA6B